MDNYIENQQANIISTCYPEEQLSINEWFFFIHNHYNHINGNNNYKLQREEKGPHQQNSKEVFYTQKKRRVLG